MMKERKYKKIYYALKHPVTSDYLQFIEFANHPTAFGIQFSDKNNQTLKFDDLESLKMFQMAEGEGRHINKWFTNYNKIDLNSLIIVRIYETFYEEEIGLKSI